MSVLPLTDKELYHACNYSLLDFDTTAEVEELEDTIGQTRALEAIDFGISMQHEGYNLYVMGSTGIGKQLVVGREIERTAKNGTVPYDWCYVNNFEQPHRPYALKLPAGRGRKLQTEMVQLVDDLRSAIPAAFNSDEYRTRIQEINDRFTAREEEVFQALHDRAQKQGVAILRTPTGYTLAPTKKGKTVATGDFEKLSEAEQNQLNAAIEDIRDVLKDTIRQIPGWQKEYRQQLKKIDQEVTELTVDQLIGILVNEYDSLPEVKEYIQAVKRDVIENVDVFRVDPEEQGGFLAGYKQKHGRNGEFVRYSVNVVVDNAATSGMPVIYENNPSYINLVGRIEHVSQMGTLLTDFSLIKEGALHKANGGYLVIDAHKILTKPFAWEGLKRALSSREIRIESLEHMLSLVSTISLEPEPIPLNVKLVLLGDRMLYYMLMEYDLEFSRLFKVVADFSEYIDRTSENTVLYAKLIASMAHREKLLELDRTGVGVVIEECARRVEDSEKISLHMGKLKDLLSEADYWARKSNSDLITDTHVRQAVEKEDFRQDQVRSRMQESIKRGIRMVDTEGETVGQVNGLSVIQLSNFSFGIPSRITATARLGAGEVIDIEREVELGGPIHSKAVMILSAFLADRYASNQPLSLSATLAFEQSYGYVEGDSASVAELCALLSAISNIPVKQNMAITGSVNQMGKVQAIGGVNEKVEGFFDVCEERGLNGKQGVIIPAANISHLMLKQKVVDAARKEMFSIYAVDSVEQVLELITGMTVGEKDEEGNYPENTINGMVQARLVELNLLQQEFSAKSRGEGVINDV